MKKERFSWFQGLKLSQKIFLIFILMLFLVINSWAFTLTTSLDFRDSFTTIQSKTFPSIILTSELKDHVHVAILNVYKYVSTGDKKNKKAYELAFSEAISAEYKLFQLSETSSEFVFTKLFNEKLISIYNTSQKLVELYESGASQSEINIQLKLLNQQNDEFSNFIKTDITSQLTHYVDSANASIQTTTEAVKWYMLIVAGIIVGSMIFMLYFINQHIRKPVRTLTKAAKQFGNGNFSEVYIPRNDELGLFAATFNAMGKKIQDSQSALEHELEKTKLLDKQKAEFLSIAAHQLRTPISGIKWANQMLYDGDVGEINQQQKEYVLKILANIDRMIKLINSLLDVTKLEEDKFTYEFKAVVLPEVVSKVIERLKNQADQKGVTVKLASELNPAIEVQLDTEKFALALGNIIDNAIKYSLHHTNVEVLLSQTDAKHVRIEVKDHGIGIPEPSQARVFEKFFRSPNAMKLVADGSGLGLFIVQHIIGKHNGKIWFASKENQGTSFFIQLPIYNRVSL